MITKFHANRLLDFEFGKVPYTPPDNYEVGISTTAPTIEGVGYTEPISTSGYIRANIPNTAEYWAVAANFTKTNAQRIAFNFIDGAGEDRATHWLIFDNDVLIYFGEMDLVRPMPPNSQIWVDVGDLKLERVNPS